MLIFWSIVHFSDICVLFQVFQLTARVVRGAKRRRFKLNFNLAWVAISRNAVEGVIASLQSIVPYASFTQWSFSWESAVAMLKDVEVVADSVFVSEEENPWPLFGYG